jgi:8-oxo-dGTP diphosphatase
MLTTIIKIGAIIFNEKQELLAVHKSGKPAMELIMPGGKREEDESDEDTLKRELMEELGAHISSIQFFDEFQDKAIYEDKWLIMRVYHVTLCNKPTPQHEIDQLVWLNKDYHTTNYIFASILGKKILPRIFPSTVTS